MQDRFGHAVVVGRDDEDLVRLLAAGHEQVDRRADDHRDDVAVDHVREAVAYQQRRADDEYVGVDDDFAVGDAPVFVEDFGDDVRAARGAAGGEATAMPAPASSAPRMIVSSLSSSPSTSPDGG